MNDRIGLRRRGSDLSEQHDQHHVGHAGGHASGTKNQFHVTSFAPHAFISCPHVVSSSLIEQHDQHHVRT